MIVQIALKRAEMSWDVSYSMIETHQLLAFQGPMAAEVLGKYTGDFDLTTLKFFYSQTIPISFVLSDLLLFYLFCCVSVCVVR